MPTVDSLDIQVSATLNQTEKALDSLVARLGEVKGQLSGLSAQAKKTGSSSKSDFSVFNNTLKSSYKHTTSLAAMFGKFYANYFMVIRGVKKLWSSIEGTTDYIEALNYQNVAFGKISSEWDKEWEKYGYENAEAYADSFTDRINDTLGKLSGVRFDEEAQILKETGMKNLGLNLQTITQYASQLASVTNSVGQTGEVSLAAADAFTKLAGDMSSLFNVDYSSVAKNLQSGLIGQSRALYKYGIDITNATLQTYAYELGLEKAVSEMTQAEKMQLRMVAILDQSKVSWGDLANTINSPSNMIRQFTTNLKEAGMVLGQLFLPMLQKVLPVMNGVSIAAKRLLTDIAGLLGIKIDVDAFGQGYTDLGEDIDGITDSLDDVTASAKKAKAGLRGFDELNVINMGDAASGVSGGVGSIDLTEQILASTAEYNKVWQEAYDQMENRAQKFADKIQEFLEPLKKFLVNLLSGDFASAGYSYTKMATGFYNLLTKALSKVNWTAIGNNIGEFLIHVEWTDIFESVVDFMFERLKSAFKLWKGVFDVAPLETAFITGIALLKWTGLGDVFAKSLTNALTTQLSKINLGDFLSSFFSSKLGIASIIIAIAGGFMALDQAFINESIADRENAEIEKYGNTLDEIRTKASETATAFISASKARLGFATADNEEVLYLETLAKKYEELSSKTNLSTGEQAEFKLVTEELMSLLPGLQQYYDETTGLLTIQREEMSKLIKEKEKELKLAVVGEKWKEALSDQVEAQIELNENVSKLESAQDAYNNKLKEAQEYAAQFPAGEANLAPFHAELSALALEVETFSANVSDSAIALSTITNEVESYKNMYADWSEDISEISQEFGENFADGVDESKNVALNSVADMLEASSKILSDAGLDAYNNGQNWTQGFIDGIKSKRRDLEDIVKNVASTASSKTKSELDIHSPSRVMYRLGGFTMEGFMQGIESFYSPIMESVRSFGKDFSFVPTVSSSRGYTNNGLSSISQNSKLAADSIRNYYSTDNSETNRLLNAQNELLAAILDKPVLANKDVFNAARKGYREEANRLRANGNPARVWG